MVARLWRRPALRDALGAARAGRPLAGIGRAIEERGRRSGFAVVQNLGGHGIGRAIHEPPNVSNTWDPREKMMLHEGLVLAIEPFLSTRARWVHQGPDGWSLCAADDSRCAQFEHTVVVQSGEPIILTAAA
jgi:methionyl aminopeptidase